MSEPIPVIDLFAGPGGLGEGFSAFGRSEGLPRFELKLSIEKEAIAHKTLLLRSFFRKFPQGKVPDAYYETLRQSHRPLEKRLPELFEKFPIQSKQAHLEAWRAELGKEAPNHIFTRISTAIGGATNAVLLGGPPCQAYSLVGRSRNKGEANYRPENDEKQFLYLEYLQVLAEHRPAVFVMENVKGLLSATLNNQGIFERIYTDLQSPYKALKREGRSVHTNPATTSRYRLYSLVQQNFFNDFALKDFIIRMEEYGIPQARHRLILVGVREDLGDHKPGVIAQTPTVPLQRVLDGLPRIRSGLSRETDNADKWLSVLQEGPDRRWWSATAKRAGSRLTEEMTTALNNLSRPRADRGGEFMAYVPDISYRRDWFLDSRIEGIWNHSGRGHIRKDLYRYFYAACFAKIYKRPPCIVDFPLDLWPDHKNIDETLEGELFADRFRVQLADKPATTITSHIAKDGHYYIHPDPTQCRSLTVREAARIQTFPDNYFFCGPRTSQYIQVGNAVPPLFAFQVASVVFDLLKNAGLTETPSPQLTDHVFA